MKTLIVYYSLEGNTEYAAKIVADKLGAELLRLVPKKAYADKGFAKFFWGGKSAVMAEKPELEPYEADLASYDRVIFGFPVWAGNFTPPLMTFIVENKDALSEKKIAAFACQSGAGAEKALSKLADCIGISAFEETAILIDPKDKPSEANNSALLSFCEKLAASKEG